MLEKTSPSVRHLGHARHHIAPESGQEHLFPSSSRVLQPSNYNKKFFWRLCVRYPTSLDNIQQRTLLSASSITRDDTDKARVWIREYARD